MKIDPGSLVLPGFKEIEIIHKATIEKHGGLNVRPDKKKIESALANVIIYHSYISDADICTLAAVVAYDFAKGHHPLPDGNKRVAFVVVRMVARLNGFAWKPRHDEAEKQIYKLAESSSSNRDQELASFAEWIRRSISPIIP